MADSQEVDPAKTSQIQHGLSGGMQETWARGDFHRLGVEQLIVGERLCEEVDVRAGDRVLDVACGAGNATLAAARRRALCTGCDFVPALLERRSSAPAP